MKVGKRQLILASMVLALGAAVYLNWTLSDGVPVSHEQTQTADALATKLANANLTGDAGETPANEPGDDVAQTAASTPEDAQTAGALASAQTFSEARLSRQQSRDEAIGMLDDILSDADSDEQTRRGAIEQAAAIAQNILRETNIENLIQAKGCNECMVYLENGQCTVVVGAGFDEDEDLVVIRDIVTAQAGISADNIRVVPTRQ